MRSRESSGARDNEQTRPDCHFCDDEQGREGRAIQTQRKGSNGYLASKMETPKVRLSEVILYYPSIRVRLCVCFPLICCCANLKAVASFEDDITSWLTSTFDSLLCRPVHRNPCLVLGCSDESSIREAFEKFGKV